MQQISKKPASEVDIAREFSIYNDEYEILEKEFGNLLQYAAWQLYKKNSKSNHTDEQVDIVQELRAALIKAGSYYKRQVYIEKCLDVCETYISDGFSKEVVIELKRLWDNKTRHGAHRQKFGRHQQDILGKLLVMIPENERPKKDDKLRVDAKFITYCKAIVWNALKGLGKKITKEKSIRIGMTSLSEFDYLQPRHL